MIIQMDNSGKFPLRVPGINAIPVNYELDVNERFAHGPPAHSRNKGHTPRLTRPEVLLLRLIEHVTDKKNWEQDIFDENVVTEWYTEAKLDSTLGSDSRYEWDIDFDMDLVSANTWNWRIQELRDKALHSTKKGYVLILNADSGVCKSDLLVASNLQESLQDSLGHILNHHSKLPLKEKDLCSILELVDPSLFMLAYGRTAVLNQGGQVRMSEKCISFPTTELNVHIPTTPELHPTTIGSSLWSNKFQWLPCEVKFEDEGKVVRIASYINNLHPKHTKAYASIEQLISLSLEPWNDVLKKGTTSRYPLRIKTFGFEAIEPDEIWGTFEPWLWKDKLPGGIWTQETWDDYCIKAKEYLSLPELDQKYRVQHQDPWEPQDEPEDIIGSITPSMCESWESADLWNKPIEWKWERLHTFKYPEAGASYSYEDWKSGKTAKPFIDRREDRGDSPHTDHVYQSISLQDDFREQGLQIVIRVSSIDLTPENPSYQGDDDFHVDGLRNEHIVGVTRYYYDVENITDARISFQQEDDINPFEFRLGVDAMHKIFGLPLFEGEEYRPRKLQTLGSVGTNQGRFLAWSNSLRYKTRPITLDDKSRPGHQRFISLFLVDPHYRICSTQNVPAQQHKEWRDAVLGEMACFTKLPQEIADTIMDQTGDWPIGSAEAQKWKYDSEAERHRAREVQSSEVDYYSFWAPIEHMEADIVVSPSGTRTCHGVPV
ncbi:hypothetical protein LT330_001935 [Penicillium expansum]|nr:hypothetical protein LT330_001935 [Penicillium expansum]